MEHNYKIETCSPISESRETAKTAATPRADDRIPKRNSFRKMKALLLAIAMQMLAVVVPAQTNNSITWQSSTVSGYYSMCNTSRQTSSSAVTSCTSCTYKHTVTMSTDTENEGRMYFKAPTGCNLKVKLTASSFKSGTSGGAPGGVPGSGSSTTQYDKLYVYDGLVATGTGTTLATWYNGNTTPNLVTTTNSDGWVTLQFENNYKGGGSGSGSTRKSSFTVTVECDCPSCTARTLNMTGCPASAVMVENNFTLTATQSAGSGTITWTSSNTSVATVSSSGAVYAAGVGTDTITATVAADGDYCSRTATCDVIVTDGCPVIGTGTSYSNDAPISSSNNNSYYSYTQQVYTATEIRAAGGCSGKINSVAFQYYGTSNLTQNIQVYLGSTGSTSLASGWITDGDLQLVYSGSTTFSSGWVTMTLSSPYEWDGTSNIVVAVRTTAATVRSNNYQFHYTSVTGGARYARSRNSSITLDGDNVATSSGTSTNNRPNIKFCIDCCTGRTITLTGCPVGSINTGDNQTLYYTLSDGSGSITWTSSSSAVSVTSGGVITANAPGSAIITVSAAESGDYCAVSDACMVNVSCGYSVPVCFDFEDYENPTDDDSEDSGLPPCWERIYSGSTSGYTPHVFNGSEARDGNGIVITSGSSSTYGNPNYVIMPLIDGLAAGDSIRFNAWWESTYYGTLTVGYMTDPSNASTFTEIGTATVTTYSGATSANGVNTFVIPSGFPSGAHIAFRWTNNSTYYLVVIDNICIYHPCTPRSGSFAFTPSAGAVVIGGDGTTTSVATIPAGDVSGTYYCEAVARYTINVTDGCARIGDGSLYSSYGMYTGIYTYFNRYGYSQQLYTASEIIAGGGCAGTIRSIALHYQETTSSALEFEIYIGTTSQNSVTESWVTDAGLTRVWSGSHTFTSANNGWNTFDISSANFEWDGESNLLIAIRRTSATSGSITYPNFYYSNATGKAAYVNNSDAAITLGSNNVATESGTTTSQRPEMKFCIDCCTRPNFSFADASQTISTYVIGQTYTGQTPNVNQSGGTVTYSSSNTSVAEVGSDGRVTVRGTGMTVITATVAATGEYCMRSTSYTLIIPCGTESHTLTYNTTANCTGGGTAPTISSYTGTLATVTSTRPNCSSMNGFVQWNTAADGSGTSYSAGQAIDLTCGDLTLYAIYRSEPDTIDGASDCDDAMAFCASNDAQNGVVLGDSNATLTVPSGAKVTELFLTSCTFFITSNEKASTRREGRDIFNLFSNE